MSRFIYLIKRITLNKWFRRIFLFLSFPVLALVLLVSAIALILLFMLEIIYRKVINLSLLNTIGEMYNEKIGKVKQ